MTTECCWPFCGAGPKECNCADNIRKEVMQIDSNRKADCESGTVAPPPVSEAGGDLPTNDEKTNMTDEACKENAEKLTVPLPESSADYFDGYGNGVCAFSADQLRAYGDERCARETAALLGLIADIRAAAGDPTGRLMQAELVELIGRQREECDQMRAAESAAIAAGGGVDD